MPSDNKQMQSEQITSQMNKLAISYLDLSDLQVEREIINQVCIQAIRAPVEAATNLGLPSGVLEFITEILSIKGKASMGIGYARDESEIIEATNWAFTSAMIDNDLSIGKGVNINITSGNSDYINHLGNINNAIKEYVPVAYSNGTYTRLSAPYYWQLKI